MDRSPFDEICRRRIGGYRYQTFRDLTVESGLEADTDPFDDLYTLLIDLIPGSYEVTFMIAASKRVCMGVLDKQQCGGC